MILSAIAAKLKQRAKADFKGRYYEGALIVQAVAWYLRYPGQPGGGGSGRARRGGSDHRRARPHGR